MVISWMSLSLALVIRLWRCSVVVVCAALHVFVTLVMTFVIVCPMCLLLRVAVACSSICLTCGAVVLATHSGSCHLLRLVFMVDDAMVAVGHLWSLPAIRSDMSVSAIVAMAGVVSM